MIRSMTGYGEASAGHEGVHYFLEARSLNNKYFKAVIRLPEEFQGLEAELEAALRTRVTRGTVTVTASCTDDSAGAAHTINQRALQKYVEQIRQLPEGDKLLPGLLSSVFGLPGVLQPPAHEEERVNAARSMFISLLDKALGDLIAMRDREGAALLADLESHRDFIAERLAQIKARAPEVVGDYEKRLRTRVETMLREANVAVEVGDLIREVAIYSERVDIAEEIKRLGGHLEQFGDLIAARDNKPIGRTLDFLAQEMLREANTIASKSPDAAISRWTVEIKGAIDRIKEQAQNVE